MTSAAASLEDLYEPAQVGALEFGAEVDGHGDVGDGVLLAVLAVRHGDRVADAGDTDFIDRQAPVIAPVLDVFQHQAASPR